MEAVSDDRGLCPLVRTPGTGGTDMGTLESRIMESPATRRLVFEVLPLVADRDPVDVLRDLETVRDIIKERLEA